MRKFATLERKGCIEYGVSARTGWLTQKGKVAEVNFPLFQFRNYSGDRYESWMSRRVDEDGRVSKITYSNASGKDCYEFASYVVDDVGDYCAEDNNSNAREYFRRLDELHKSYCDFRSRATAGEADFAKHAAQQRADANKRRQAAEEAKRLKSQRSREALLRAHHDYLRQKAQDLNSQIEAVENQLHEHEPEEQP